MQFWWYLTQGERDLAAHDALAELRYASHNLPIDLVIVRLNLKEQPDSFFALLPPINAAWRTADVLTTATAIYQERRFVDLPVLADALADAGCTDPDILGHLRKRPPHIRGCRVLYALLGIG